MVGFGSTFWGAVGVYDDLYAIVDLFSRYVIGTGGRGTRDR